MGKALRETLALVAVLAIQAAWLVFCFLLWLLVTAKSLHKAK